MAVLGGTDEGEGSLGMAPFIHVSITSTRQLVSTLAIVWGRMGVSMPARAKLGKMRAVICSVNPAEASECISYGIGGFKDKGPLMSFPTFTKHGGFSGKIQMGCDLIIASHDFPLAQNNCHFSFPRRYFAYFPTCHSSFVTRRLL